MIDTKLLEEFILNIDTWKYADVKRIELLSKEKLKDIIDCVPYNAYSNEDVINACITALCYMTQFGEVIKESK